MGCRGGALHATATAVAAGQDGAVEGGDGFVVHSIAQDRLANDQRPLAFAFVVDLYHAAIGFEFSRDGHGAVEQGFLLAV